jgi:exonuclease SbcC
LQKVRSLDQKLADQKKAVSKEDEDSKKTAAKIDTDKKARQEEQGKLFKAHEARDLVDGYLKEHTQDEWLISGLAGVEEQLSSLLSKQNEILQKEAAQEAAMTALELATKSLSDCQKQSSIRKQELEDASKQLQQGKDSLCQLLGDRLLREYRTEKEALLREMALLMKIAELEEHRAKLEDGKPCPLCGALEHPFAEGNIPVPDKTEQKIEALTKLINKAEDHEAAIKKLEEAESQARKNLIDAEKLELAAANDKRAAEKALTEIKDSLVKLLANFAERRQAVTTKLKPLGIADISETDISSMIKSLRARLKAWQTHVKKKADIEKQIADINSEVKRLEAVIETQNIVLAEKLERLGTLKKELSTGIDERNVLYGDKNPDDEERLLSKAIVDAEGVEKLVRERHNELQQKWNTAKSHIESLKKCIDQREPQLRRLETEFSAALALIGFSSEEQFLAAMLSSEEKARL